MKFAATFLQITAAICIVYGGAFIYAPEWIGLIVTESLPSTTQGMTDYRATYGGLQVGVGLFFAFLSIRRETVRTGLYGLFFMMACMGGARYYGILVDGEPTPMMLTFLGFEALAAVLSLAFIVADMVTSRKSKHVAADVAPETAPAEVPTEAVSAPTVSPAETQQTPPTDPEIAAASPSSEELEITRQRS